MGKTKQILKGKFPRKPLTLDQQVETVNNASGHILEAFTSGDQEKVDRQVNNYALWLGGLHPDIQVYAFQILLKGYKICFDADDKTEARMARLEERIEASTGYVQYTYDKINHYPWPVEFLDGTTFEDRLESLAEEVKPENIGTADMILNGIEMPSLEDSQVFGLLHEISDALKALYDKGQSQRMIFQEKVDNALGWVLTQPPEYGVYFGRLLLSKERVVIGVEGTKNVEPFISQYEALIIG